MLEFFAMALGVLSMIKILINNKDKIRKLSVLQMAIAILVYIIGIALGVVLIYVIGNWMSGLLPEGMLSRGIMLIYIIAVLIFCIYIINLLLDRISGKKK